MSDSTQNQITLTVGGKTFGGWTEMTVSRAIDRLKSVFTIGVTDRWVTNGQLWQITPFSPCVVKIGSDVVLTGYVGEYSADFDAHSHRVTITGASTTGDLVKASPDIASGQFKGYTLEQIARAICQPFKISLVVQTNATQVFQDATLQRGETAFTFLERLSRLSGVLLTDDANGNLVLATAGTGRASGSLVQGVNVLGGNCKLNVEERFSDYILKGQRAIGSANASWNNADGGAAPAPVVTNLRAVAKDTGVPRYLPHVSLAEAQLDQAGMQRRVNWERNFAFGRATRAEVTVPGWRQPDGTLWAVNTLVSAKLPFLQIDQDLLIAETTFSISPTSGTRTKLRLGPVEGFTPDPGQVKLHTRRGKKGSTAPSWDGNGVS